ncbi:hypothetical protein [Halogeometricum luteum]|uniref:MYXO-CTERM domain-containing protein n=1 Tax=Halogeometricum luteum TaxID=2950537 RepID=A0ABU2FZH7_9EURY|nr:hypothetical protein [Halogeometricum sp. S3BR5-2]MDS0293943.1 hypothetical protein [Halogeometricum sp. S3BR5-2]
MALIELDLGSGQGDEDGEDAAETRLDGEGTGSSTGRRLLGGAVVVALAAGAGYVAYRRRAARDESGFTEIEFDDEAAEAVESNGE